MTVTGFRHAGVTVRDLETSLRFYRDALGLRVVAERTTEAAYLREVTGMDATRSKVAMLEAVEGGGAFLELLEWGGIERQPASCRPCDYGSGHVCLFVDDLDALAVRLRELGYPARVDRPATIPTGPNAGAKCMYALDPDGYTVELFQPAAAATGS